MKRIVLALALVMLAACGPTKKATDNLAAAKTFLATNAVPSVSLIRTLS